MKMLLKWSSALAIAAVLAACGSGGGDSGPPVVTAPQPTSDIPASAQANSEGLIAFLTNVIATMTNDTSEPLLVGNAVLPVSDNTEPVN